MEHQPDLALVDVCLEGGREGIETARWLREVCGASVPLVTARHDEDTVRGFISGCLVRRWCESRSIASPLPMPLHRSREDQWA